MRRSFLRWAVPFVLLAAASCGRGPAPDATVAEVWSWAYEDQPYLTLRGDGSLVHRGEVVGSLDLAGRRVTVPPHVGGAPFEELGPVTSVDGVAFVKLMRMTMGVAPDGSILAVHIDYDAPLGASDTLAPWGRLEPADAPEPVRTGLLWAAVLYQPDGAVNAEIRLREEGFVCPTEASSSVAALGDGRLFEGRACPGWAICDLGAPAGRWDAAGGLMSAASDAPVALDDHVHPDGMGGVVVTPVGQDVPWFVVTARGAVTAAPEGPARYRYPGVYGRVDRAGAGSELSPGRRDAQAAILRAATDVARDFTEAYEACRAAIPPPPPPPPLP